jgi:hypothetical protein
MGKATPHPADRQPCGYKSTHQRGAIACPSYQLLRNRVGYFWRDGKDLGGWVLGLSFLCSVVCFVFLLTYQFFSFITSCCISLLYVIKIPNDFLSLSLSLYQDTSYIPSLLSSATDSQFQSVSSRIVYCSLSTSLSITTANFLFFSGSTISSSDS